MTIIKDCIYGLIDIPETIKKFLDTPQIQRLRNISQLGFVQYVYPSAVHTRFEHSLGVMHLAGTVMNQLQEHGAHINTREKLLVQTAALFHDAGHVAFSHLIDYILVEQGVSSTHEIRSIELLRNVNAHIREFTDEEIEHIAKMILGEDDTSKPFLYQIVHNRRCGLDVDRLDYLQRDAYYTGVAGYNPNYLIKCMIVHDNQIYFLPKAIEDIKTVYETRRKMFVMIYRHKTVLRIEQIIRNIIKQLGLVTDWKSVDWVSLDDVELVYKLKSKPEFLDILYRTWIRDDIDLYNHCETITTDEIEKKIKEVNVYRL